MHNLDDIRRSLEIFFIESAQETYLHLSGLKAESNLSSIYEKYKHLFTKELVLRIKDERKLASGEEVIGDPVDPRYPELYKRFCENFSSVVQAFDELRLMGCLPYFQPGSLFLKESSEDVKEFCDRFSGFIRRYRKWIILGFLAFTLLQVSRDESLR